MATDDIPKPQLELFLSKAEVADWLDFSTKTIERRVGIFPQPIPLNGNVAFVERELVEFQEERPPKPLPVNYEVAVPKEPPRKQPLKELFPDMFEG